nr:MULTISPECIES: Maff2 family protein [Clostridia]
MSDTRAKCRIGTAKFFTLLLLLYHTSVKSQGIKQLMSGGGIIIVAQTVIPQLSSLFS